MKSKKLLNKIDTWSDEEVLEKFALFLDRVTVDNQLLLEEDGSVSRQVTALRAGDNYILSEPTDLGVTLFMRKEDIQ